jgi:hypothetical protein
MKHVVTLFLKRGNQAKNMVIDSVYHTNPVKSDMIFFLSSMARIVSERSKGFDADSILTNDGNTIFRQIMKTVLFCGAVNRQNTFIHKLRITKGVDNVLLSEVNYKQKDQPLAWHNITFTLPFQKENLADQLFAENYGDKLSTILSHWLTGISSNDRHKKFESLWRSFEQLADHHNRAMANRKEFDNLREMRTFMEGHIALLPHTAELLSTKDYAWLRSFQWKQLIYNNYPQSATKKSVWEGYRDNFVLRNTDRRIIQLINDTLVYRKKKLENAEVLDDINAHIAYHTARPVVNDIQLAAFMCCKLAYYLRNKIFHGEIYERHFRFYNVVSDDYQLDEINAVLEMLTYELIDHFADL